MKVISSAGVMEDVAGLASANIVAASSWSATVKARVPTEGTKGSTPIPNGVLERGLLRVLWTRTLPTHRIRDMVTSSEGCHRARGVLPALARVFCFQALGLTRLLYASWLPRSIVVTKVSYAVLPKWLPPHMIGLCGRG